ncbi:unnamed protein product [Linum tenue]|uniref:Co-chaperone protein p23 n=1 Tax=Linum tenue TaxID=586396 RepID=A0AAV0KH89_9ROSI|nr:unnamed protein product [Linum tenue]
MSRHPILKWAQRSDKIYLTVDLADAKDVKLKLEPDGKFIFSAVKDGCDFVVDLELFDKVNVEESKYVVGPRNISYIIIKAESNWWPRLIKQEGKTPAFLKADWDKWVDEDEENGKPNWYLDLEPFMFFFNLLDFILLMSSCSFECSEVVGGGAPGGMDFDGMDFSVSWKVMQQCETGLSSIFTSEKLLM